MSKLEEMRYALHQIIEDAAADALKVQRPDEQVSVVVQEALERQREWFVGLINERLDVLRQGSSTAIVLRHLRGEIGNE